MQGLHPFSFLPGLRLATLMLVVTGLAHFSHAGSVKLDETFERKWLTEYSTLARSSKNQGELIEKLRCFNRVDAAVLLASVRASDPLPAIKVMGRELQLGSNKVKIISLDNHDFLVNGVTFHYEARASLASNIERLAAKLEKKVSILDVIFPAAFALGPNPELDTWTDALSDPRFLLESGAMIRMGLKRSVVASVVVEPIHWLVTKAEAYAPGTPNCETQVRELGKLLQDNHLRMRDIDCGLTLRTQLLQQPDRSISFVTADGKERKFFLDWNRSLAWEGPERVYLFGDDNLRTVRRVANARDPRPQERVVLRSGHPEFEATVAEIEPFRRIFHYLGTNRSCFRCEDEIKESLERADRRREQMRMPDLPTGNR